MLTQDPYNRMPLGSEADRMSEREWIEWLVGSGECKDEVAARKLLGLAQDKDKEECTNCSGQGVDPNDEGNSEMLCSVCGGDGWVSDELDCEVKPK